MYIKSITIQLISSALPPPQNFLHCLSQTLFLPAAVGTTAVYILYMIRLIPDWRERCFELTLPERISYRTPEYTVQLPCNSLCLAVPRKLLPLSVIVERFSFVSWSASVGGGTEIGLICFWPSDLLTFWPSCNMHWRTFCLNICISYREGKPPSFDAGIRNQGAVVKDKGFRWFRNWKMYPRSKAQYSIH